eukprot:1686206-Rhodomonas_salina.1
MFGTELAHDGATPQVAGEVITLLTDVNHEEIRVFSSDLQVGGGVRGCKSEREKGKGRAGVWVLALGDEGALVFDFWRRRGVGVDFMRAGAGHQRGQHGDGRRGAVPAVRPGKNPYQPMLRLIDMARGAVPGDAGAGGELADHALCRRHHQARDRRPS